MLDYGWMIEYIWKWPNSLEMVLNRMGLIQAFRSSGEADAEPERVGPCKFKANLIDKVNSRPTRATQVKCLKNKKTTTKNPTNKQKQDGIYKNLKIKKKYSLISVLISF